MIKLICVGKIKSNSLKEMADDYTKRIGFSNFFKLEVIEVKDETKFLEIKGRKILLDETGKLKSTEEFFKEIDKVVTDGEDLTFCIAGQDGCPKNIKKEFFEVMSLSPMTFTHDAARVIFLEQLYRTCTIKEGKPYHRA